MSPEIQDKLLDFMTQYFLVEKEDIILDESLIDQGIIDSFGLVEIVSFMEEEFNMTITDEQMNRDNLGSVLKMVAFIKRETSQ